MKYFELRLKVHSYVQEDGAAPSNNDRLEVRNSITLHFNGGGPIIPHLFNNGIIKSSAQIHQERNQSRAQDEQLTAEENQIPSFSRRPYEGKLNRRW